MSFFPSRMGVGPTGAPASGGPSFSNVVFLYNNAGVDTNNPNGDSAVVGGTMTFGAGTWAYQASSAPFGGVWLSGSQNNFGRVDYASAMNIGTQDFCFETHLRYVSSVPAAERSIAGHYQTTTSDRCWLLTYNGTNLTLYWSTNGTGATTATRAWSPSADTTYHIAVARDGAVFRIFVDGTQVGSDITGTASALHDPTPAPFSFAGNAQTLFGGTPAVLVGPTRYVVGESVYTSNFTKPSALFPES